MLKIAYISPIYFSNVDIPFLTELQHHCEVHYYAIVGWNGRGCAIDFDQLPAKAGIYSGEIFPEVRVFDKQIDLSNTTIVYYGAKHNWHPNNLRVTMQLAHILKKENFDIIHLTDVLRYYQWPLLQFSKKMIMSVHDPFLHSSMRTKIAELYRNIMFRKLSHFILFNNQQKQEFIDTYHLQTKQVFVSSLSKYSYLTAFPLGVKPDYHYALFFGKIRGYKGLEYLFPAMKSVHEKHPDFKLIVAGVGAYYFDISEYKDCGYIDIQNRFFKDKDLAILLAHADYIVCPYNDATQSGVVMAAYAFDKPCIVTNVGGLPEMVGYGKYGLIVPPRDFNQLAKAMCTMIENPELLKSFANEINKEYTSGILSWEQIVEDLFHNVYSKI